MTTHFGNVSKFPFENWTRLFAEKLSQNNDTLPQDRMISQWTNYDTLPYDRIISQWTNKKKNDTLPYDRMIS